MAGKLDRIVEREVDLYLKGRATIHLEAAIGSLLHSRSIPEVAKMLRDHADHLEQFG